MLQITQHQIPCGLLWFLVLIQNPVNFFHNRHIDLLLLCYLINNLGSTYTLYGLGVVPIS